MINPISRQYERVPLALEVMLEGASGRQQSRTGDISLGGCFIDTTASASPGEVISFRAHLPEKEWLELQGEVRYQLWPIGFGLRFTDISEEARSMIAQLIADYRQNQRRGS